MKNFLLPDTTDKRIAYAGEYLESKGFSMVNNINYADFVLLGVNPENFTIYNNIPVYAGNVSSSNVFDYTKQESFALENAYLTSEGAVALAISNSTVSLVNSSVLIIGYGRIGKALHKHLSAFTSNITICARSDNARTLAVCANANATDFDSLKSPSDYDFVFNTVAHPVLNERELRSFKPDALLIDLASFPGGIDKHFSKSFGLNLVIARGLPAKYSPYTAGKIVGKTVEKMIKGRG